MQLMHRIDERTPEPDAVRDTGTGTESFAAAPDPARAPSRELLVAALQCFPDGVWITDCEGAVVYRNDVAVDLETRQWSRDGREGAMREVVFDATLLARLHEWGTYTAEFELSKAAVEIAAVHRVELRLQILEAADGRRLGISVHARDTSREWSREQVLHDRHIELESAYTQLKQAQMQLLQSEKMASIGQLAAGVAHEINNPIGYVHSNLGTLQGYVESLLTLLDAYEQGGAATANDALGERIAELRRKVDFNYLRTDLPLLVEETREGIGRVRKIVGDLRDFSHAGQIESEDWVMADVHRGIESTLNIVWNDLKYKVELTRDFGDLPLIECMPAQLNQVFMNLLVNAGHSITEQGHITIRTRALGDEVEIAIRDDGHGIPPENLKRIFDPFFTTKPVGTGTGLGLSLSYGIIQKHQGRINVESTVGVGTTFQIFLPVKRAP